MSKGLFITFEGGEGAGKSTLIAKIQSYLSEHDQREIILTREPGGSLLSEDVRDILLRHSDKELLSDKAELMLFLSARAQHVDNLIRPALEDDNIVLCDRFVDSSMAYQGVARGFGVKEVEHLCRFVCGDVWPQITFFLDLDPRVGLSRNDAADRIESEHISFHDNVRAGYTSIADSEPERYIVLDATLSKEALCKSAIESLKKRL